MITQNQPYWFHAKRYGWGWGLPATWQGWAVLMIWLVALTAGAAALAGRHWLGFTAFVIGMVALLTAVCYVKGEPARWRWGDRN